MRTLWLLPVLLAGGCESNSPTGPAESLYVVRAGACNILLTIELRSLTDTADWAWTEQYLPAGDAVTLQLAAPGRFARTLYVIAERGPLQRLLRQPPDTAYWIADTVVVPATFTWRRC